MSHGTDSDWGVDKVVRKGLGVTRELVGISHFFGVIQIDHMAI